MLRVVGMDVVAIVGYDGWNVQLLADVHHGAIDGVLAGHVFVLHQLQVVTVAEYVLVPAGGLYCCCEVSFVAQDCPRELS